MRPEQSVDELESLDGARALHEEVGRLPEKYRAALVLCYFEGMTHEQAAAELDWPLGTVRSRLAYTRDRLRSRLARRGLGPTTAVLAATVGAASTSASVPTALASATVGMAMKAGHAGAVPASVSALVARTLRDMAMAKLTMFTTGLVAARNLVAAAACRRRRGPARSGRAGRTR